MHKIPNIQTSKHPNKLKVSNNKTYDLEKRSTEASEAMSKRDFVKSIKICRKKAKESKVWLRGLKAVVNFKDPEFDALIQEATEFIYIFTSILKKTDRR